MPAPRPYPQLAKPGRRWLHIRRYWIAYRTTSPPVIIAACYDAANIPKRLWRGVADPTGPSLKLLALARAKGLDTIA
ncbi:MAG: hypothetical protein WCC64_18550 [Aliidongia sp.]